MGAPIAPSMPRSRVFMAAISTAMVLPTGQVGDFLLTGERGRGLFRQHLLVCPFARRDRVFWIDTDIWPAACVDTDPTSCAQGFAFASKQKTRVVHDAP